MKSNYTYIAEVLDRSGSMNHIADKTREGHNEFLRGQKATPGECSYLLVQFDHIIDTVYDGPLAGAQELTPLTYVPRGSTALLDAIGDTITALGQKLGAVPEDQRPEKVVVVILTDGQENASMRYTRERIFEMITHQRDTYHWEFLFLGANQDAITEAAHIGISSTHAANFAASNTRGTYSMTTNKVSALRNYTGSANMQSAVMSFTEAEREELEKPEGGQTA